jgi:hypothetical protein
MKWRPRVSLLTLLLLMTTLALSVSLWQMGQDIVPLRNTLRDLRQELGQFNVADFDRVHVQRGETVTGSAWKWRLYLPQRGEYRLCVGEGNWPELMPGDFENWRAFNQVQYQSLNPQAQGQFTLELAIEEYGGKWWIKTATMNEVRNSTQLKGDWYAELSKQIQYSDASYERVSITDATEPVVLLYVRRGEKEQVGDTYVTKQVAGEARTLVVWITPSKPSTASTSGVRPGGNPPILNRRTSTQ